MPSRGWAIARAIHHGVGTGSWPKAGVGHRGKEEQHDVDRLDRPQRVWGDVAVPGVDSEEDHEPWPFARAAHCQASDADQECRRNEDGSDAASPGNRFHLRLRAGDRRGFQLPLRATPDPPCTER